MAGTGGLLNFLEKKKVTGAGEAHTHMTMPPNPSKYFIGDDDLQEFYELYHEYVAVWNNKIAIVEAPNPSLGLCKVDLDFLYEPGTTENLHTRDQMVKFSIEYVKTLKTFLNSPDPVEIFVMAKKFPVKKEKGMAGGVHIMVPAMRTNKYVEMGVRNIMLTKMSTIFENLPLKEKEWPKVYDEAVAKRGSGLIMYGAAKPGGLPYLIEYRIMVSGEEAVVDDTSIPFTVDLLKRLDIRERDSAKETPMTEEGKKQYGNTPDISTENVRISGGRAVGAVRGRPAERRLPGSRESSPNNIVIRPLSQEELKVIQEHVANLCDKRANDYAEGGGWIEVGMCLKNIHPELFDEFEAFSMRSSKYEHSECVKKWNSFGFRNHGQKVGMGSLRYWSKVDNPERYKEIENQNVLRMIDASRGGAEYDVACVVYSRFRDEYKCVNYGKNVWFRYVGHVWVELDKGVQLQQELSIEIFKMFMIQVAHYNRKIVEGEVCQAKEPKACGCAYCKDLLMHRDLYKVAMQLKKTAFKANVMRECQELFLDEQFTKKIDENRTLMACANGVFDMETCVFRPGQQEDYVSFSTNIEYDPDRSYKEFKEWKEIDDFLHKIFPIKRVRDYQILHMARCLNGIGNQKFHTWTGVGSNGKSMLICLMESALGDYACKVPISLLTQGRNKSGAAAPELIRLKGRRFVTMQEPDESVPLNTGFMKELTSNEKIIARDLYAGSKAMIEFELQAKLHLACNDKPKINTNDQGTWRRFVVINFISKFIQEPKGPHEYKMDMTIERKVKSEEWGRCFLAFLIQTYTAHAGEDIIPPAEILEYTNEYREESNAIMRFINEYTRPTTEGEEVVPVRKPTLSDKYRTWMETNLGTKNFNIQGMLKEVETKYGKYTHGGWKTFQIRNDVD
jgi:P4 family phage/plasmid primase-like protien